MAPRRSAAQRAAEAAEAEQTPDVADGTEDTDVDDVDPEPEPEPDSGPEPETGDADALRYVANRLGAPESYVHKQWPHAARGDLATQLLKAAEELGYPADVVRSTSDGFRYPEGIDRYLFPSEYAG